jgi:hypothetical protein
LPQHERERDGRAGRNEHPIRFADVGDGLEELAHALGQRLGPLQHERIDDKHAEENQRKREHELLGEGEILEPHRYAS